MLVFVMVIATLLTLAERKWSALMQDRIGPNRARIDLPGPAEQPARRRVRTSLTDVLKMLTKEDFRPEDAEPLPLQPRAPSSPSRRCSRCSRWSRRARR